jgi:hypothetical protein
VAILAFGEVIDGNEITGSLLSNHSKRTGTFNAVSTTEGEGVVLVHLLKYDRLDGGVSFACKP